MSDHRVVFPPTGSLAGARIWLSGSVPDIQGSTEAQREAIRDFVRRFADRVFQLGGHIIHGSHPSFTPILLEQAQRHQMMGGRKDCLVLAVSGHWSRISETLPLDEWRKVALVYETPEIEGENTRDDSLKELRRWMAARCDAVVVVGGRWWEAIDDKVGVPLELDLAIQRGLPCFLLGGLGGAAQKIVERHTGILAHLKNGLDAATNHQLSISDDIGRLADDVCRYLTRLPLVRGRGSDGASFRILALDGGGLKGAFTAAAIAAWEKHTGLRVADHFDLIAGTSTGGILALGLGLGLSGEQMLGFYRDRGPVIFPLTRIRGRIWHTLRHLIRPKFSQAILLRELEAGLYQGGNPVSLKQSRCRLLIPTYHAVAGASHQFRTPHHADLTMDANTEAAHAALATAAAPTFFSAAVIANMVSESSYFDGGVWANSPAMAAIIEAVCFLHVPLERIDVLSVGTTEEPFSARGQTRAGLAGWIWKKKILELLMNAQQESALRLACQLVTDARFLRVNSMTEKGLYKLDGAREIGELADLGHHVATQPAVLAQIKSRFLNGVHAMPWQSYP